MSWKFMSPDNKKKERPSEEPEDIVQEPSKEDVKGRRNPKKKDKDYERKYGSREDSWN